MKQRLVLLTVLINFNIVLNGQILSKEVRNDFCRNAIFNYYYGSNSFKSWMIISAQKIGSRTPLEIEESIQNLCSNIELQEEFFKSVDRIGGSREFKEQQYIEIGMKSKNAKLLNDYMILKYHIVDKNQLNKSEIRYLSVKDTMIIDKKNILSSLYPQSSFLNDSLVLRKENVVYINGGSGTIEYKTSIIKEYSYIDKEEEYEEKLKIIMLSTDEKGSMYLNILTMLKRDDENYQSIGRSKRVNIEKNKQKSIDFYTFKENGNTYFTISYINENNEKAINYYSIDLSLVKTIIENSNRITENFSDDEDSKENNENVLNNGITYSTKGNDINQKDLFDENTTTTKCRVYKKETWIYSRNSFKNNEESKQYRVYKLTEGERVDVIINWDEVPKDIVKVIYYDKNGDKIIGYMVTSSLQFLEAG